MASALEAEAAGASADLAASIMTDAAVEANPPPVGTTLSGAQVLTSQGLIQGLLANNGTRIFLGLPYAEPAVGALRFRPPQPARPWGAMRLVETFGPSCVQPRGALSAEGPPSEDCLDLNVYAANRNTNAPVLVFIHGGAFVTGTGNRFDGQLLAESGQAIVVTINYAFIDARFGAAAPLVRQQYSAASDAEANNVLVRLGSDLIFRCPARAFVRRTSAQGSRAFLYHFEEGAAFHAFELPHVFGTPEARLGAVQ